MKKLLILAIFLLQVTSVFAGAFQDTFPTQAFAGWTFDTKWSNEFLGYTGKDNEMSKAYKEVAACLKERVGVDIEKDFERFGVYIVPGEGGVDVLGVFAGKFNTDKIINLIKTIIPKFDASKAKLEDISINGKKIQCFKDETYTFVFYSNEIILFGKHSILNALQQNGLTFGKAPQSFSDYLGKRNSFLYISKSAVMFLAMLLPPEIVGNINSIVGYLDEEIINLEFDCGTPSVAEQMKSELEKKRQEYGSNYSSEFEKNKKELIELSLDKFPPKAAILYSSAKGKDFVDGIKFSTNSNSFVMQTKADAGEIVPGIVGLVVPIAMAFIPALNNGMNNPMGNPSMNSVQSMPDYSSQRSEARKNACFSNQRILQGAVEMYNMDNEKSMMKTLDMPTLIKDRYMKDINKPEPQCEYESVGDMSTDDGYVKCKFHGSAIKAD